MKFKKNSEIFISSLATPNLPVLYNKGGIFAVILVEAMDVLVCVRDRVSNVYSNGAVVHFCHEIGAAVFTGEVEDTGVGFISGSAGDVDAHNCGVIGVK